MLFVLVADSVFVSNCTCVFSTERDQSALIFQQPKYVRRLLLLLLFDPYSISFGCLLLLTKKSLALFSFVFLLTLSWSHFVCFLYCTSKLLDYFVIYLRILETNKKIYHLFHCLRCCFFLCID